MNKHLCCDLRLKLFQTVVAPTVVLGLGTLPGQRRNWNNWMLCSAECCAEIIFFDEPTTGLDPIMAGVINDLIREIVTEMGVTAMTITHDMSSVRAIADQVAMLHLGKIQWTGPVKNLTESNDPFVDQFIHGRATGPIEAVR